MNGGTCNEEINRYNCLCPAGTTGDHCDGNVTYLVTHLHSLETVHPSLLKYVYLRMQ